MRKKVEKNQRKPAPVFLRAGKAEFDTIRVNIFSGGSKNYSLLFSIKDIH